MKLGGAREPAPVGLSFLACDDPTPWEDAPEPLLGPRRATPGAFTGCPTLGVIEKAASF